MKQWKFTVKEITLVGLMVAVIEVCKAALTFLPNIELTTFWIILFTLFFGKRIIMAVPVFILLEGCIYGFGLWWVMYLYLWPLLAVVTCLFRKQDSVWFWSVLSGIFGLLFGLLCAIPYVIIGAVDSGITNGLYAGFTWWVAGIPWDIIHAVSNFTLMTVLYSPIRRIMSRVVKAQ